MKCNGNDYDRLASLTTLVSVIFQASLVPMEQARKSEN